MISLPLSIRLFCCTIAAAVLPCLPVRALTLETVHAFSQGPMNPNGGVILGPDGAFYGLSNGGGGNGAGTFYKMELDGTMTLLHEFSYEVGGASPNQGLLLASDGNFYGAADGTIFRLTPQGILTPLRPIDYSMGYTLSGPLVQGADGTLHGSFMYGGANNRGTVFSIKMDGSGFSSAPLTASIGSAPSGSLVVRPDGIYGVAQNGGASDQGVVFKRSLAGALELFSELPQATVGIMPKALVFAGDGNFYGITSSGMGYQSSRGTVFRMTTAKVFTSILTMGGGDKDKNASLTLGADGQLYGYAAGSLFCFKLTLQGYSSDIGKAPLDLRGDLVQGPDGAFYGTAYSGGAGGDGCVFKLVAPYNHQVVHSFQNAAGIAPTGFTELADKSFVGSAGEGRILGGEAGWSGGVGTGQAFRLTQEGKFSFLPYLPATRRAPLVAPDQSVFGMTGTQFFRGDLTKGKLTLNEALQSTVIGSPNTGLTLASDGNFYGGSLRRLFKITPAGVQTVLANVNNQGAWEPKLPLTEGADGMLYGVITYPSLGSVFRVTKTGSQFQVLKQFENTTGTPSGPLGSLVRHPDGNLYGVTYRGGAADRGAVFKISSGGAYSSVASFASGIELSSGGLTVGADNALYGISETGTASVFRMTTSGSFSIVTTLDSLKIRGLNARLVAGSDGNLYGAAERGGLHPNGVPAGGGAIFRLRYGPTPKTTSVTEVGNETARFQGTVDPRGRATTVTFQCATKPDFSDMRTFPAGTATATGGIKSFTLDATGLALSTRHYVRMAASNSENTITQVGDAIQFTTFPLPADIVVENAAGLALPEDAIIDVGGTTNLRPATHTFTVRNNGQVDLTDTQITITGGAPQFSVVSQPASVIPAGGSSTFTVSLLPTFNGAWNGSFRVDSSDRYRTPIAFGLKGSGITLSTVDFDTDATVPVTVTSLNATGLQLGAIEFDFYNFSMTSTTVVTLVKNTGSSPVQGHFDSLPEGSFVQVYHMYNYYPFKISYVGGDGNDVVLIRALPPTASFNSPGFLNGEVYANFSLNEYGKPVIGRTFEYGLSSDYGSTADIIISNPSACYAKFPGNQGTLYYYRLTVTTTDGTIVRQSNFITSPTITNINFPSPDHIPVTTHRFYASGDSLNGTFQLGFDPSPNQTLMLVKQTGTEQVSGTYRDKPQGTLLAYDFQGSTIHFILRYDGGDGNDIVLVRTYPKENARYATAKLGESFFYSYRVYNSEFTMTGVPSWLAPSRSTDYLNFYGTPTAKGIHRITVTLSSSNTPVVIIVNVVEPVAQWRNRHFTPLEIGDPNVSGSLADASGNGVTNLMKYALGIPAKSNATGNLPKQSLQRAWNDDYLALTYTRDPHAEGITYNVEVSDGLGSWKSGAGYVTEASRTPNPDGTETVVVWDVNPVKSSKSRFMRLKVTD